MAKRIIRAYLAKFTMDEVKFIDDFFIGVKVGAEPFPMQITKGGIQYNYFGNFGEAPVYVREAEGE